MAEGMAHWQTFELRIARVSCRGGACAGRILPLRIRRQPVFIACGQPAFRVLAFRESAAKRNRFLPTPPIHRCIVGGIIDEIIWVAHIPTHSVAPTHLFSGKSVLCQLSLDRTSSMTSMPISAFHWPCVTSVCPSQNGCEMVTRVGGLLLASSRAAHRECAGGDGHERDRETRHRARLGGGKRNDRAGDSESGHGRRAASAAQNKQ